MNGENWSLLSIWIDNHISNPISTSLGWFIWTGYFIWLSYAIEDLIKSGIEHIRDGVRHERDL